MERTRADDAENQAGAVVRADFAHEPDGLEALTSALWKERELLDQLLFALTSQRLILESRNLRWLSTSSTQVNEVIEALREHEIVRAIVTEAVAAGLGLDTSSQLHEIAAATPEPHAAILDDLGSVLRDLADEVNTLVRGNDSLLLSLVATDSSPRPAEVSS